MATPTTITSAMLDGLRRHIGTMVSYARYRIGTTWYRAEINSREVRENNSIHITFYIPIPESIDVPANRFQLCDANGNVLAERTEDVPFALHMDTILYRFKFGVSVGQAN